MIVPRRVFITGIAGFVGFHLALHYLERGWEVAGADSLSPYYSPHLKQARLRELALYGCTVAVADLSRPGLAARLFADFAPQLVFHLAAQPGARTTDLSILQRDNLDASAEVLSAASNCPSVLHLLFASSSSIYGGGASQPLREDATLAPSSPYAASKAANEEIAAYQAQCGRLPITALRFFNVYGPWGRPDMAPFMFADALADNRPVMLNNGGQSERSWLFVDDAVRACGSLAELPPGEAENYFRAVNVAGPGLVRTLDVLHSIADWMGRTPRVLCQQIDEPAANPADLSRLHTLIGEVPQTTFAEGIGAFLLWHRRWRQKKAA